MTDNQAPKIIVLYGPSGVGKGTLVAKLREEFPDIRLSVSHTSRAPRVGEEHGVHYYFVDKEEFQRIKNNNGFIEDACFAGNLYGTSFQAVDDITASDKIVLLEIETNGVEQIANSNLRTSARFIFIEPPSLEVLEHRLNKRGTDTSEVIQKRIQEASKELEKSLRLPVDLRLVNHELEACYARLSEYVQEQYQL